MRQPVTEAQIRQIYGETIDALYAYASRKCGGDRALAEDVTQETWLRAVRDWPHKGIPNSPLAWLTAVARNLLFNHFRQSGNVPFDTISPREILDAVDNDRVAQTRVKELRSRFEMGVITRAELVAGESQVRAMELALAKTHLDMEEIRASASAPREELWAPLVSRRDFVKQRLELDAALLQQRLTEAEEVLKEADGRFRTGVGSSITLQEARVHLMEAQRAFEAVAQHLALRRQFIDENLRPEDLSFRVKVIEVQSDLAIVQAQTKTAEMRAQLSRERYKVGSGSEIEVKRAELELLELKLKLEELTLQLQLFQTRKRSQ